jgi:DNA-binding winged helix-turn-helix (wHTH) protein/tetratricopeptide (TPR) repeat protein
MILSGREEKTSGTRDVTALGPAIAPPPMPGTSRRRWHFGHAILDERTLELLVDGVDAELERKPLEVLIYLLQHAGEICTKDELLAGIWPGRILSETVLTKCIGRLRDVLRDDSQEIIKTAHGFGYRFVAPVRVESVATPEPAHFDLRPGAHPPSRPLWSLVERLGIGGHGEAWRARHDKTNEQRVFKFALEEAALVALKREITLFRVINDTLGDSAKVVTLLDWNLEQVPYFVEAEYIAGGSLVDWVAVRGGVGGIPLPDRVEIVARIAEALAAVHSVGVIHKDLKPSNVLVRSLAGNEIEILLGDFGSGGVLDGNRLEELGITRLGFTKTVAAIDCSSATPLYLAPEILAGQPFTVKSDIYALGIILYQFLAGDFHKVMSPGWERGIEDELLREDIALMAEGNPAERMGDADGLARRLRALHERRRQLAAEREVKARAERTRRLLDRARARRFGLIVALVALLIGTAVSTTLYIRERDAQKRTVLAAAQSKAVKDFLSQDVFAPVSSGAEPVREMTVIQLLTRAGDEIDLRFGSQPDVAAELHYVIGRSFESFLETSQAVKHFRMALDLGEHLSGQGSQAAMRSAAELIPVDYFVGALEKTVGRYNAILAAGRQRAGEQAPAVLDLRLSLARGYSLMGAWSSAARMFQDLLSDTAAPGADQSELQGRAQYYYGQVLTELSQPAAAERYLRLALDRLTPSLGERHAMVTDVHSALGRALADQGRFEEALLELSKGHELALAWAPIPSWIETRPRFFAALMLLREDRPSEAQPLLAEIVSFQDAHQAAYLSTQRGLTPELDHTGPVRQALGEAYLRQGRLAEAVETLQQAVKVGELASGARHPSVVSTKLSLAEALIANHRNDAARGIVASIQAGDLAALPPAHPILAQWYRARGLLDFAEDDVLEARRSLTDALDAFQSAYGPADWHVARARQDLKLLSRQRL